MNDFDSPRINIIDGVATCRNDMTHHLQPCRDPGFYNCAWCGEVQVDHLELMKLKLAGGQNG